jgi:hypothetical protein
VIIVWFGTALTRLALVPDVRFACGVVGREGKRVTCCWRSSAGYSRESTRQRIYYEQSTRTGVFSLFNETARFTDEIIFPVTVGEGKLGSASGIPTECVARPRSLSSYGESGRE